MLSNELKEHLGACATSPYVACEEGNAVPWLSALVVVHPALESASNCCRRWLQLSTKDRTSLGCKLPWQQWLLLLQRLLLLRHEAV